MARLLLLDDDESALTWMKAALESRGHEVETCTSARAALESLERSTPDLIVADVMMPEMDGLAFARVVRRHRGTRLVFVSVTRKQAEAVLLGAAGFVQKPATAAEVRLAVERALGEGARKNTILVVDDDPDICALYRTFLERSFAVATASNGVEALEVLRARRVDLVIVDVHMPVMNGAELVRAIRHDPALERLPVLVQTSDVYALKASQWATLGVSAVLDKERFIDWFESLVRGARRRPLDVLAPPPSPPQGDASGDARRR